MMPIGPLMVEHRLIERMIKVMGKEIEHVKSGGQPDMDFIMSAVDFIRSYADRCHHGKEEDILFKELYKRKLSAEHKLIIDQLVDEHVWGRKTTGMLEQARQRYAAGDLEALEQMLESLEALVEFYPNHIMKEDKGFFMPCMGYFTKDERDKMLSEMMEFDQRLIHERYGKIVEAAESRRFG